MNLGLRTWVAIGRLALSATAVVACDKSTGPESTTGIRIVAGAGATDSILASLLQALVVEVRDANGARAPEGTVVRFESVIVSNAAEAYVGSLTGFPNSTLSAPTTDERGRAAVLVRLGTRAGQARIAITVPTLGLLDTARFTVVPGNPARVVVQPADTLVYPGAMYTLRGSVADAYGNPRSESVSFAASETGATVTDAGVVTASTAGRYTFTATATITGATATGER